MKKSVKQFVYLLGTVLLASACTATTDPTRFYSLLYPPQPATSENPGNISVGISSVRIPRLLDRPQIISRKGQNEIVRAEFHQWGGSLLEEIEENLASGLSMHLNTRYIFIYPAQNRIRPDYELLVDIHRFDGELGEKVFLNLTWQITPTTAKQSSSVGRINIEQAASAENYSAYVTALNQLLSEAAAQIALELSYLNR